jgi:egghead protein (zeste-white 4 protein)
VSSERMSCPFATMARATSGVPNLVFEVQCACRYAPALHYQTRVVSIGVIFAHALGIRLKNSNSSAAGSLAFNEDWFFAFDTAVAAANQLGLRLIVPFINVVDLEQWGGAASLARWAQVPAMNFFVDPLTRTMYKKVVWYVLSRRNRITGRLYKDEPAIFGWELGNELFSPMCNDLRPPHCGSTKSLSEMPPVPIDWTREMAAYIRSIDGGKHLIIDGGYVKNGQALQVADLDLVGGTYYSSDTTWLQQDVETVGGRLPFILKEFGLAGESNLSTVNETLGLLKSSKGIAGGLYWSFRGHAKEGGFYWHYEALYDKEAGQMIYPQALHWPGFDDSYPTYERTIIDLLTTANSDWDRSRVTIFNESSLGFIPCQPTVTVLDAGAFPPCFAFVGATGAARYEIWARAVGKLEENPEWFRLTGDAHDAVKERTSVMTFVDDDSVRQLMGFAGTSEGWQFCFQSCSLEGLCSDCSSPVLLTLNATGEPSSMCGNGSAILVGPRTEDVNQLGLLLLSFSPPLAIHIVEIIAQCLAALGAVVMLWLIHMHLFKQLKSVRKYASTEAMDLSDGSVHNAMPDLGVVAVPNLDPNDPTRGTWRQDIPIRLGVIYCISTLLILMDARRAQLLSLGFDSAGVHSALPLLFVAFGFDSWVRNMDTTTSQAKALSALGYASKHLARHAPAVIVSSCIGFAQTGSESLAGEYILLPLGLSVWIPSLRNNESNSLVWIAGALVFNSLLFLPLRDAMVKLSPSVKTRLQLLLCCWLVTAWQALDLIGLRLFLLDRFTAAIYLRTYAPSFIAGVLLASLHSDLANNTQISHWQSLSSLLSLLVLSAAMYVHIYLPGGWQGEFLDAWVHTGLYLPLVCMLVFGAARARRADPIAAMCGAMSLFAKAAPVCFTVLFFEQPIYGISAHILDKVVTSEWQILLVYLLIGLMFSPVFDYATRPLQHFIRSLLPADEYVVNTTYAESGRAGEEYAGVRLFIYYFGFVGIVVTFCMAQLFDPWVSIVDVSDLSAFSDFLSYFSWVLLLPAPCLLQCLLGFMIYPAVKEVGRKQKSITQQLEDEAKTKPVSIASRPPFKIHFRIVTRGKNPNLVLSNCQDALQVLRKSGLPESRFKVDVATDEHMDTMTEVPDVDEIVVPRDYSPPGGCKYKARALHYAAATSSSLHHDWIVHLDEETRFDVDTVEHIFAHCVKQEQDVARGVTQYPSIGQGVIYYNTATIDNYLTTLADYIRVADDYAKFQLQYKMFRLPLVGMHGSFVVCQTSLERDVGWDWGMVGSITEDTYFAMYLAAMGVRIDWCGGKMYEQSPFSCSDFAKQRARWFSGLWLCVLTNTLPLWQRAFLGSHLVSWSLCPLFTLVTWVNLLVLFPRSDTFVYLMSFVFAIPFFGYVLGYVLGSSPSQFRHGIVEWALLLIVHVSLIPVYTIMETWGVARGILDRSTYSGFHVGMHSSSFPPNPPHTHTVCLSWLLRRPVLVFACCFPGKTLTRSGIYGKSINLALTWLAIGSPKGKSP